MTRSNSLTYGLLYSRLKALGFEEFHVDLNGKRGRLFQRSDLKASTIVLPERGPDASVEPFYLGEVLLILKRHNLLPEPNPLAALQERQGDVPG